VPLDENDWKKIGTYFQRNYRRGESLDVSRPAGQPGKDWNDWMKRRLQKQGWQRDGKPFLTDGSYRGTEDPPRIILRESDGRGNAGSTPNASHLEFKVFMQDRIEKVSLGRASPRILHWDEEDTKDDENNEYIEYAKTWSRVAEEFEKVIFIERTGLTRVPDLERRWLSAIDEPFHRKEEASKLQMPTKSGEVITFSHDEIMTMADNIRKENRYRKTTLEISRIVVKSLISKSTNSYYKYHEILQSWRDKYGDQEIIDFYNSISGDKNIDDFKEVKKALKDSINSDVVSHGNKGQGLWDQAQDRFGRIERLCIHCTGFEVVREIGEEISKLLLERLSKIKKGRKKIILSEEDGGLGISSNREETKQIYTDLFKSKTGLVNRGFGKKPQSTNDWARTTRHNSIRMAYNVVNILLEKGYLSFRKMSEKEYRDAFLGGDQDKEINREIKIKGGRAISKEYPNLLVFTKKLKKLIGNSEYKNFKKQPKPDHNAIYRWLRTPSDRWMYSPPENHIYNPPKQGGEGRTYRDKMKDSSPGGFLNKQKRTLVSNHRSYEKFGNPRSLPSRETVDALNLLQSVQWEINLNLLERICDIRLRDGSVLKEFFDSSGASMKTSYIEQISIKPNLSEVFLRSDDDMFSDRRRVTLEHLRRIIEHNANVFWHSWFCDFRGRMLPRSNYLSPQGNDIDRALIRFKEWRPLGEGGIRWLRIHVHNLMQGVELEEWRGGSPKKLQSFDERDEWVENNIQILRKIASNFDLYRKELELDKVASAKSEVFQRLAALIELDRVYSEWETKAKGNWSKVKSGQPVYIDASSNGYQHVSCLLRDRDLAEKVNVVKNEKEVPEDLYSLVAQKANEFGNEDMRKLLSKKNLPDWDDEDLDEAIGAIFHRSTAKKPTMIRVYGSRDFRKTIDGKGGDGKPRWIEVDKKPLTQSEKEARNKVPKEAREMFGITPINQHKIFNLTKDEKGQKSWKIYRDWKRAMSDKRRLRIWAKGSSLHEALIQNMDNDTVRRTFENDGNPEIQMKVSRLFKGALEEAIEDITNKAYEKFEEKLKALLKAESWKDRFTIDPLKNKRGSSRYSIHKFHSDEHGDPIGKKFNTKEEAIKFAKKMMFLYPGIGWVLDDGFEIRNYYIKQQTENRGGAPSHPRSSYNEEENENFPKWYRPIETTAIQKRIIQVLEDCRELDDARDDKDSAIYKFFNVDRNKKLDRPGLTKLLDEVDRITNLKGETEERVNEIRTVLLHREYNFPRYHDNEEERIQKDKPKSSIAPNFIHSLDALHMRRSINRFANDFGSKEFAFWAVHDAFGTHPSEVDLLLGVLKEEFRKIHQDKDLCYWVKNIATNSGLNPDGLTLTRITVDLDREYEEIRSEGRYLDTNEISKSQYLVH